MAVSNFSGEYNKDTYKSFEEVLMNDNNELLLKNFSKELGVLCEGIGEGEDSRGKSSYFNSKSWNRL